MSDDADLAELRRIAEDPLAHPSERIAARAALKAAGELPARHCIDCGARFLPPFPMSRRCRTCRAALVADIDADGARPEA